MHNWFKGDRRPLGYPICMYHAIFRSVYFITYSNISFHCKILSNNRVSSIMTDCCIGCE